MSVLFIAPFALNPWGRTWFGTPIDKSTQRWLGPYSASDWSGTIQALTPSLDIKSPHAKCTRWQHREKSTPQGRRRLYAGRPWQRVAINSVGPTLLLTAGNNCILVLTDHFTRWQDPLAILGAMAPTLATILEERVFCYLGLSEILHSNQGSQFESALIESLCQRWG